MKMKDAPVGMVVYRGPSRIDGSPIVAIATGLQRTTSNVKTGPMVQVWILRADVPPHDAARDGRDASICGQCPHRRDAEGKRSCYVRVGDAPLTIWRAWRRGLYRDGTPTELGRIARALQRGVRIGAYGDPMAVPVRVWRPIVRRAPGVTAYTHQWDLPSAGRLRDRLRFRSFAMASVDSEAERDRAHALGWRTFRVSADPADVSPSEIMCPSERGVQCADCLLCGGELRSGARSIVIPAHGSGARYVRERIQPPMEWSSPVATR